MDHLPARLMHHIDKGTRHYFWVSDQWRNYKWQSICSKMEHLSDEGADVLAMNPAAKSRRKKASAICWAPAAYSISKSNLKHFSQLLTLLGCLQIKIEILAHITVCLDIFLNISFHRRQP